MRPDPVLLFRYSALTFNGHRIHYDQPYVTGVEGYPGLIVHGPLIATLLICSSDARRRRRRLRGSPSGRRARCSTPPDLLTARPVGTAGTAQLWAEGPGGVLATAASATTEMRGLTRFKRHPDKKLPRLARAFAGPHTSPAYGSAPDPTFSAT